MSYIQDDLALKYESPYVAQVGSTTPEPSKRRRTPCDLTPDTVIKRQRIGNATSDEHRQSVDHLAAIVARAAASASQQITRSSTPTHNTPDAYSVPREDAIPRIAGSTGSLLNDSQYSIRILSLPVLESISMQIIAILIQHPYLETIQITTDPSIDLGRTYRTLKSLLDETLKMYQTSGTFLDGTSLNLHQPDQLQILRLTNVTLFVSSVFSGTNIQFHDLNDHLLDIFTSNGESLSQDTGNLYIDLKTQMYLAEMSQEEPEKSKEHTLYDLFPQQLEMIVSRRHGGPMSADEAATIKAAQERHQYLVDVPSDADNIQMLSEIFPWEGFLASLNSHLNTHYEAIVRPYLAKHKVSLSTFRFPSGFSKSNQMPSSTNPNYDDIAKRAADDALQAIYGIKPFKDDSHITTNSSNPECQHPTESPYSPSNVPYPTQSAPTQVLYERARLAAVIKAVPPPSRRPGLPSQRRPWSTDEENALMAGLDAVKGPHWSQILVLYGMNGVVSDVLKERNQVQLKDKARNLKLFFLKSCIEVPYYLQSVTGELKTRAPGHTARQEAEVEERERVKSVGVSGNLDGEESVEHPCASADADGVRMPTSSRISPLSENEQLSDKPAHETQREAMKSI